jgi:SPP1 family predicted phage head-tail adaptor
MNSAYPKTSDLNRRVTLQSVVRTPDANGIRVDTWTTYASAWAKIRYGAGREQQRHQSIVEADSVTVTIRYRTDVAVSHRILYGTRYFFVNAVTDVDESHAELELQCTEVSA